MTNEVMAMILDRFHNGYPVEVSRDEAQALKAGAAALRAVQWRPIETFPRTDERVLLLVRGEVYTGTWNGSEIDHSKPNQPTHWLPLPAPPKEGV